MLMLTPTEAVELLRSAGVDVPGQLREAVPRDARRAKCRGRMLPLPVAAVLRYPGLPPMQLRIADAKDGE